jgi:membrane-associated protein
VFDEFKDWVSGEWWSYAVIFAVSAIDAFFPLVPSESVVITAGNIASSGDLWLLGVILSASAGAVVGDNISYAIGKWAGEHTVKRLFRSEKARQGFAWAERQLETRGFYIIVIARFIPGGRTAVTFASGYTHGMTWRRFIVADICAGLLWGTYAAMLGYIGGKTFEDAPWKGLLLGFVIAIGVALGVEVIRWYIGKRRRTDGAETTPPTSTPEP